MSKNAIAGLAVALCLVAASVGAFFATRSGPTQISSAEPGVSVAPERVQGGPDAQIPPAAGTDGFISQPPAADLTPSASMPPPVMDAVPSPAPAVTPAPAATPRRSPSPAARTTRPSTSSRPSATTPTKPEAAGTVLEKPWPSGAASGPPATPPPPVDPPVAQAPPPPPPPPPVVKFDELVVSQDAVIGLKLDSTVNSETARVEDPVEAHVTRDLRVGSRVAIPVGTRVLGSVTEVDQGGKMKNKAKLGIRFHTLVLGDGTRSEIETDAIYREGDSPGQEAAGKMGAAAAGGAILGAILGGGKGAAVGGSIGAAGGAAAVMAGKRNPAVLQAGTAITVRLLQPVSILVER